MGEKRKKQSYSTGACLFTKQLHTHHIQNLKLNISTTANCSNVYQSL